MAGKAVRLLQGWAIDTEPWAGNRFLLSSTTFSPALFLSQMHSTADTQSLISGLEVLSKSIDQKSASLKVLVESNFERFVRAKATIDNVYKEMKYRGADPTPPRARAHSRHASRNSFRSTSGPPPLISPHSPAADPRKKNALIKESEYGVLGVKAPLLDVSAKAEDVWGPALGGREKEEHLKTVASSLDQYKEYVETSAAIADSIKRKDHETLVEEYTRARKFADEAKQLAEEIKTSQPTDEQLYRILLAARMWHDVDEQIQVLKRDIWRRLISPYNMTKAETPGQHEHDQHMELITLLLELGVEDNPIWVWLLSRYDYLKSKIQSTAERSKVEIEILRRRLANAEKPSPHTIASHMRTLGRQSIEMMSKTFDSSDVIELWEMNVSFVSNLLSPQGILGEVLEFWQTVQGFIDGKTQKSMPVGYNGESTNHHRLSLQGTTDLQKGTVELVSMIRDNVLLFFAGPPPEDISLLFSPMPPQSPGTPGAASVSGSLTPRDPRFNLDPNNPPPPSPKRGEAWEKFAFWPPWSNSLSGVHFLSKMLALVGGGASDMASISPVGKGDVAEIERVKALVGVARERCVTALCAAWNRDAENIKYVEDWNRSPDSRDVTRMPASFAAFEGALLTGMQKILYISEAMSKPGAGDIVVAPPTKLLQMVRSQYVTTLYKALSGMVENAERFPKKADDEWTVEVDGYVLVSNPANPQPSASTLGGGTIDAGDRVSLPPHRPYPPLSLKLTNPVERPHALDPQQPPSPPIYRGAQPQHAVRKRLLRQAHRRDQNNPRRSQPNRRPPLPVLHAALHRRPPPHHPRGRGGGGLGPSRRRPQAARGAPLRLRGPPEPRAGALASVDDGGLAHDRGAVVPARAGVARAARGLQDPAPLPPRGAHAGHARRRVRRPDAQPLHHGPRVGAAERHLPGAGRPDRQRRARQAAGRAARDAGRAEAAEGGKQGGVCVL